MNYYSFVHWYSGGLCGGDAAFKTHPVRSLCATILQPGSMSYLITSSLFSKHLRCWIVNVTFRKHIADLSLSALVSELGFDTLMLLHNCMSQDLRVYSTNKLNSCIQTKRGAKCCFQPWFGGRKTTLFFAVRPIVRSPHTSATTPERFCHCDAAELMMPLHSWRSRCKMKHFPLAAGYVATQEHFLSCSRKKTAEAGAQMHLKPQPPQHSVPASPLLTCFELRRLSPLFECSARCLPTSLFWWATTGARESPTMSTIQGADVRDVPRV